MAKVVPTALGLDDEVAALVQRLGNGSTASHIIAYSVDRISGNFTKVTVAFIADEEFSKVTKEEPSNG